MGEGDSGIEETLAVTVMAIGFGGCADIACHAAAAHDDRDDAWNLKRPGLIVAPDAEHEAAAAGSAEQIAMKKEGPSAEHGFLSQPREAAEGAVDEFFEAGVAGHGAIVGEADVRVGVDIFT